MSSTKRPPWARFKARYTKEFYEMSRLLNKYSLNTVCRDAHCPNIFLCWGRGTATFMILGDTCTRRCGFCSVKHGDPGGHVDWDEPRRVAEAVRELGLKYVVITSVYRDDLPDGGASVYAETIRMIRRLCGDISIEVLVPDFNLDIDSIKMVVEAGPDVFAHNIETVERLTPIVRDRRAGYRKSLEVLRVAKKYGARLTKSGLMLGLGEAMDEVLSAMRDLRSVGVDILTIGQYLPPTKNHLPVAEYVHPSVFAYLRRVGMDMGFKYVFSGPRVRSSFLSDHYINVVGGGYGGV